MKALRREVYRRGWTMMCRPIRLLLCYNIGRRVITTALASWCTG